MRLNMPGKIALVVLAASLAAGCVFFSSPRDRAIRRSPSFKDGYSDGCAAAAAQGSNFREGPLRDETLYNTDSVYRAGWANGYQSCSPAGHGVGAAPGANPIPQPEPGH